MENKINDIEILERLQSSTEKIHKRLDVQCALMENVLNRKKENEFISNKNMQRQNEREKKLVNAIKDTIDVLEQTKKSFKSKRLEMLRKKLTDVLIKP